MSSTNNPARYHAREAEAKWQAAWNAQNVFATPAANEKPDYFVLEMFPYPSGNIHMGHVRNYTLGDVTARFRRARGYNVLYPMGWDAFGLPAENAAIQRGVHPGVWTKQNIATMREQLKSIGLSYDWSREVMTCEPGYYQHEQRFFLQMLKAGIAFRKQAVVNWDPVDHTVLANEQVIDGKGWRSGAPVERRTLSQWFLRITDYAEDLLQGLSTLEHWPEKVRLMQEKWIGKSSGALFDVALANSDEKISIYTTRPDTLYGMSFVAIAPDHSLSKSLAAGEPTLQAFIKECSALGTSEEAIEKAEKKGFDTGLKAINPLTGFEHPVYVANFVLMDYGTGAVFGCPAHDERDFEFATKYGLPIVQVIDPAVPVSRSLKASATESDALQPIPTDLGAEKPALELPYTGDGVLVNSLLFNGLSVAEAKEAAIAELEARGIGQRKINYRLRDWGISRQRYWGAPIPIIHCADCGAVPVPDAQLPVTLPEDVTFDKPGNPLAHHPSWKQVNCPSCGNAAERETDTFDTFFESSWYFASYASGGGDKGINAAAAKRWLPVDQYIGGIEHAVLHLLYARFFTRALKTCGVLDVAEPFAGLMTQGMIGHATFKDAKGEWVYPADVEQDAAGSWKLTETGAPVTMGRSEKMSKSKKNTIDPRSLIDTYGADTARLFMLSDSPPERDLEWTDAGVDGAWRYLGRLYRLVVENKEIVVRSFNSEKIGSIKALLEIQLSKPREAVGNSPSEHNYWTLLQQTHKTIDAVTRDIEHFHFNKAVARIRELTNAMEKFGDTQRRYNQNNMPQNFYNDMPKSDHSAPIQHEIVLAQALVYVIHLIGPFMPHLAEELWLTIDQKDLIATRAWPVADPALLVDDTVTIAIQVNGKLRATLELAKNLPEEEAKSIALGHPSVIAQLDGKTVKKTIVVPNRIINVVAA